MIEPRAAHLDRTDLEASIIGQLVKMHVGRRRIEWHREVRIVRLQREHHSQVHVVALASMDVELVTGSIQRREERQALDMVPVRVADQQVGVAFAFPERPLHQVFAKAAQSGSSIEDDARCRRVCGRGAADLDTAGVATVALRRRAGHRIRAAYAPEPKLHLRPPLRDDRRRSSQRRTDGLRR